MFNMEPMNLQKVTVEYPLVSIITPSLNQGKFIEETIKSVLSQDYPNIEYIVMDGGSTDKTIEILKKYNGKVKWISEPDEGQAVAVNKGFDMAQGEILGWLNSDDTYNSGAISAAVKSFLANLELIMIYGDANIIDVKGNITGRHRTEPFNLQRLASVNFICQPSVFLRREVVEEIGMLDINLHTCLDYDFWIRTGKNFGINRINYLKGIVLANTRKHDETKTNIMCEKHYTEIMDTVKKHFGYISDTWISGYLYEVALKNKLKKYENSKVIKNAFYKSYYLARLLGLRWACTDIWRKLKNSLWCKIGSHYLIQKQNEAYQNGRASRFYCVSLNNKSNTKKLLLKGRHTWPSKRPLKMGIIINGNKIDNFNIKRKGKFKFAIDLPENYKNVDLLTVVLTSNKTLITFKHGMNNGKRRSFLILERLELI